MEHSLKERPLVILDRDGTIIRDHGYSPDSVDVQLLDGALEGLSMLAQSGRRLAIATNQSGVGYGYFSASSVQVTNEMLRARLAEHEIRIDAIAVCYHRSDDTCGCRKPAPGLAHQIARELGVSLCKSVVIGDKLCDIGLAMAIGAYGILVAPKRGVAPIVGQVATVPDLTSAASVILADRWPPHFWK